MSRRSYSKSVAIVLRHMCLQAQHSTGSTVKCSAFASTGETSQSVRMASEEVQRRFRMLPWMAAFDPDTSTLGPSSARQGLTIHQALVVDAIKVVHPTRSHCAGQAKIWASALESSHGCTWIMTGFACVSARGSKMWCGRTLKRQKIINCSSRTRALGGRRRTAS